MTQAQKLEALVRKAVENGWRAKAFEKRDNRLKWPPDDLDIYEDAEGNGWWLNTKSLPSWPILLAQSDEFEDLLFNHDFARALFGEEPPRELVYKAPETMTVRFHPDYFVSNWQYHLQQAVISDNPIDYMYKEVFGDS